MGLKSGNIDGVAVKWVGGYRYTGLCKEARRRRNAFSMRSHISFASTTCQDDPPSPCSPIWLSSMKRGYHPLQMGGGCSGAERNSCVKGIVVHSSTYCE